MTMQRMVIRLFLACAASMFLGDSAIAHGGVVQEEDLCVIKVSFLRAHFKVYQPLVSSHEQFCEDLPVASESVFVMEYQHDALATMPIDFRIIRDVTGLGRFARMEDVEKIDDLDSATVFYQPALVEPDVFTVMHEFDEDGDFIGIVSATQPDTNKVYAAVFPFEVGFTGIGYWPFFIVVLVLLQLQYLVMSGRLKRWMKGRSSSAAVALLLCAFLIAPAGFVLAEDGGLRVTYSPVAGPLEINRIHSWVLHVESVGGAPIENADIEVTGGMPEHDHGLPTQPRVTTELGNGDYRLDGVRFHMRGYWEITVTVTTEEGSSVVVIPVQL
ncbi:MAG: FixH family protein [Gammaproteobacteria bacterium]|nr:FixH family protein [Gammaproteobacteria bacterium]NNL49773.1 FixH family protein [Woeseiaceae bacterium]